MADKNLSSLTAAAQLDDADLLIVEQQGEAKSLAGAKLREYVEGAVEPIAERAEAAAENAAENASDLVEATLEHYRDAAQLAATTAGQHSQEAQKAAADAKLAADSFDWDALMNILAGKVDNWYQDPDTHYVYLTSNGEPVGDPLLIVGTGGGGGGGEQNNAVLTFKNTSGWIYKTVSKGAELVVTLEWSSIEDELATGDGVLRVTVNGTQKYLSSVKQGTIELDIGPMLSSGSNSVKFNITDTYGNSRTVSINVTAVALELTSPFDATVAYTGGFAFPYVPTGSATKTVYFEMDGSNIGTATVTASGRQQTFNVPAQTHGEHILECWFEATIEGETVESNKLRYAVICLEEGNKTPVIATDFNLATAEQYDTITIPYIVYDPASLTSTVTLSDGTKTTTLENVDRTKQAWSYRPENEGALTLSIATIGADTTAGTPLMATVNISLTITPTTIDVEAETENLSLYLTSYGRNNNEANPGEWQYGAVSAELTGFNFTSDGWQLDEDGATVLRVSGDARVNIPVQLFKDDFRTGGKTIEVKFATRDVLDYDAPIITCWSGDRGLQITAQKALLKSEQSEISTQYKADEKVHLAFVVEKKSAHRLLMIYINGILSGVVQYPDDDDFSQNSPVGISIGSNDTTTDIYCIRVYENDLTRYQVLDNWNAEMQLAADKADTWRHNDIFDDYGQIVIDKLPGDLPYLVLEGAALPTYKGNKLSISGRYVDPVNARKSFTFKDAEIDVQGTSSAGYERKNYIIDFKNGFIIDGTTVATYVLGENNLPASIYTFKADVASSEGANNVELVKLYNDVSPRRTPPQQENSLVRQGIDGYPCVIFHDAGDGAVFIGKYNFNHDKKSDVFGFAPGSESWETKNNTSNRALWKDPDFSGTDWQNDFEARYPKDNTDITRLSALAAWIASTDRDAVTSEADKAARLQKFKDEIEDWFDLDGTLFYYLFTELFLLADSRTKNSFPTKYDDNPWDWLPYDMDTALGINNEGKLAFGYELEDTDLVNGAQVYTGQKSVMWNNVRDAFPEKLMEMYQKLRSDNLLSYDIVNTRFENHQSKWPEAIFNEDAYYKYLAPLFEKNNGSYLGMLQGSKAEQRKWWLYNRFRYIDSKYNAGDALTDFITLRGYAKGDITVTPYADIYATVKYGSYLVQERALRGGSYTLACPVDDLDDTEIYIYSASQIAELGDLSDLMVGYAEFAAGTKLKSLKLGDSADTYSNPNLTQLYAGNNVLLRTLDVRNCPNLGNTEADVNATPAIDLSGCTNIEHVYFDNTAITGLTLPNGGILKTLHLPETMTNLTIRNQTGITDFTMPGYSNITTLRIENVSDAVPTADILAAMAANSRVRLIGFDWTFDTAEDILSLYDRLDTMRGLNESGGNENKAQMSGTVRVENITGAQLSEMQSRYSDIKVIYAHITSTLTYCNWDGTVIGTETIADGGDGAGMTATRASDAQYIYTHSGWSLTQGGAASANALKAVTADRTVYATYSTTLQTYTVTWKNGSTVVETDTNVPYGTVPTYNGSTPVDGTNGLPFEGWTPTPGPITGNTTYTAKFQSPVEVAEITDSWDTILANIDNGTYSTVYKVGNYKPLDLGTEGIINMQIAAFDKDDLASGTGKAPVTFIAMELLATTTGINESQKTYNGQTYYNAGGWGLSDLRTYCNNDAYALIPATVRGRICEVNKLSDTGYPDKKLATTSDKVWIPSMDEVGLAGAFNSSIVVPGQGESYHLFSDAASRIKNKSGSANIWWLRTSRIYNGDMFACVSYDGKVTVYDSNNDFGVALGFCTGRTPTA